RRPAAQVDDDRLAHHALERDLAQARTAVDEMVRCIDVRASVAAHREQRHVAHVACPDGLRLLDARRGVTRIHVLPGAVRDGHVERARGLHPALRNAPATPRSDAPCLPRAPSAAPRTASRRLTWSAMFFPAMSNAVPWPVDVRMSGSPMRSVTTRPKPTSFTAISP